MAAGLGGWITGIVFWGLLLYGFVVDELDLKRVAVFLALWFAGRLGLPYLPYKPAAAMFMSWEAALDIILVLVIFKGDIRLT